MSTLNSFSLLCCLCRKACHWPAYNPSIALHFLMDANQIPWQDIQVVPSFTFPTSALLKFPFPFHTMAMCSLCTHFAFLKLCNCCFLTAGPPPCSFTIMLCPLSLLKLTNLCDKHLLYAALDRNCAVHHCIVYIYTPLDVMYCMILSGASVNSSGWMDESIYW